MTITGGHIQSKAQYGAGIGGGWGGQLGGKGDVLITGGEIEAEGLRGAGIGGGGSESNDSGNEGGVAKVKIRGENTIIKRPRAPLVQALVVEALPILNKTSTTMMAAPQR